MPQLSALSLTLPKNTVLELAQDKSIRAPKSFLACLTHESWFDTKKAIDALLENNLYATHPPQHYWYRIENEMGVFEGFLTGVELDENQATISTHEEVLPERVSLFSNYLTEINRQAEPLLLLHESPDFSQQLKAKICHSTPDFHFQLEQEHHQLWIIPPEECKALEDFSSQTAQFHLADGHHRLASTQQWAVQQGHTGVALSFVLASDQLENKSFLWAIKGAMPERLSDFFVEYSTKLPIWAQTKEKLYSIEVPPQQNPVLYLYQTVLANTIDSLSARIDYFPQGKLSPIERKNYAVIFGYNALEVDEIIALAKQIKRLPPKSTYIHPKLITGLFLAPLSTA